MERQGVRSGTAVADLRRQVRQIPTKGAKQTKIKPPKPPKMPKPSAPPTHKGKSEPMVAAVDKREEMAEKAERIAQMNHSNSLLKNHKQRVYKEAKPKGGAVSFVLQLMAVVAVAAGVAYFSDPAARDAIDFDAIK